MQPLLHDLVTCVRAPTTALSDRDGQLRPVGAQGVFTADVRVLSAAVLTIGDREPEGIRAVLDGPAAACFTLVDRHLGDRGADPSVRIERRRVAEVSGLSECVAVLSTAGAAISSWVQLDLAVDLAAVADVKAGLAAPPPLDGRLTPDGACWVGADGLRVQLLAGLAEVTVTRDGVRLRWPLHLAAGAQAQWRWDLRVTDPGAVVAGPPAPAPWVRPVVVADDVRLPFLLAQSLDDLDALRLVLPGRPDEQFLAAGSPWFLTLFGRDSLWAARMLLPLGTELAAGTLEVLASRQGDAHEAATAQEPGKILHELRRGAFGLGETRDGHAVSLPPVYYGTVDATALWVLLLHDAWRWGMAPARVGALVPQLEAAVGWLTGPADADGDGFLEYADTGGRGLSNQGWKDSGDSVRFRDGTLASGPIALAEVQGYAYEAAGAAATLLAAFGRPGAERLLAWRAVLADRFRACFWVDGPAGRHPAMALDGRKRPVDSLTSNIGHLLGTGLLQPDEAALVAGCIGSPELDSGYGLRTMSSADGGYSPLSYHCGSVWPHDTAVVAGGLVREGFHEQAASLVRGLLVSGATFSSRLPELYAGDDASSARGPAPYPAACRPQAWAAASAVSALRDLLGLSVDVPAGVVRLAPLAPGPAGALRVEGLAAADGTLSVEVDRGGVVRSAVTSGSLRVEVGR